MPPHSETNILAEAILSLLARLDHDRMLLFAPVRTVEIPGEAAMKLSAETRHAAPEVPWSQIAAIRNRLIQA